MKAPCTSRFFFHYIFISHFRYIFISLSVYIYIFITLSLALSLTLSLSTHTHQAPPQIFSEKQHFVCTQFSTLLCFHVILCLIQSVPSYLFPSLRIITVFINFIILLFLTKHTHNIHKHAWHTHTRCAFVDVCEQRNCAWVVGMCVNCL